MEKVLFNEIQISKALEKMAKKIDEYNFIAVYHPLFSIVHHHFLQDLNHE